jgi:hypothetical protein
MAPASTRALYASELIVDEGVIGLQGVRHAANAGDQVTGTKLIGASTSYFRPKGNDWLAAGEPPVFIEVVSVQLDVLAGRQDVFVERCRINVIQSRRQGGAHPLSGTRMNDTD